MPDITTDYLRNGYFAPLRVLSTSEAAECAHRYHALETRMMREFGEVHRFKLHLLVDWLADIVRHQTIIDVVEPLIGPDILCWSSDFFVKPAHDPGYISLHQDSTYAGLEPADQIVNVWLAFTPSTPASGCLQVVPGSHDMGQVNHTNTHDENNMLFYGQTAQLDENHIHIIDLALDPGEASLHHMGAVHGSQPNTSDQPRIGFVLRYMSPLVRQHKGPDSATLVRGKNTTNHFELEPWPKNDWSNEAVTAFRSALSKPSALG